MGDHGAVEILLVEDTESDAQLTIRALKKHNLANHLRLARDGVEALEFVFGRGADGGGDAPLRPRLILLDIKLPRLDGIEVLRRLKSDERTRTIPVVMLTSSREERDVVESYRLGANSFIVKPVEFDRFAAVVAELGLYWMLLNERPGAGGGVL